MRKEKSELAAKIREVRGERTQSEFAHLCSVSRVTVSRWERDIDIPQPSAFARIAILSGKGFHRGDFWELSGLKSLFSKEQVEKLFEGLPDDIRAQGWTVAVHNDYRLKGQPHTFWLFTNNASRCVQGEGRTDADALNVIRALLKTQAVEVSHE